MSSLDGSRAIKFSRRKDANLRQTIFFFKPDNDSYASSNVHQKFVQHLIPSASQNIRKEILLHLHKKEILGFWYNQSLINS